MEEPFNGWAVLELMGHRRLTGLVREVTLAGAGFLRIDVYEGAAEEAKATQFYPPSSVYCLTPTSEEAARKASMPWQPAALAEPATVDCPPGCQGCSVCGRRCDDCQEWGEECTCDVQDGYCLFCDSPCEGGECDPPHRCSKHARCAHCNS